MKAFSLMMMVSALLLTATDSWCIPEGDICPAGKHCCEGTECGLAEQKGSTTSTTQPITCVAVSSSSARSVDNRGPGAAVNEENFGEYFGEYKEAQPDTVGIPAIMAGVIAVLLGCIAMLLCFAICGRPMLAIYARKMSVPVASSAADKESEPFML